MELFLSMNFLFGLCNETYYRVVTKGQQGWQNFYNTYYYSLFNTKQYNVVVELIKFDRKNTQSIIKRT